MKAIVLITGDSKTFGHGHQVRMHNLALELKRRQLTTIQMVADPGEVLQLPLPASVIVLDRRDTDFNEVLPSTGAARVALDNRGNARQHADLVIDALPHIAMSDIEYEKALAHVILPQQLSALSSAAAGAQLTVHSTKEAAEAHADFTPASGRYSPSEFLHLMLKSSRPAVYFGQALFEALYAGKHVQLYPVSDYHMQLAADLAVRLALKPALLQALDGKGLTRVADILQTAHKQHR